jgi:hypothetical protein
MNEDVGTENPSSSDSQKEPGPSDGQKRPQKRRSSAQQRMLALIGALAIGLLLGHISTRLHGKNFAGSTEFLEGIGTLHRVAMPQGVISLEDAGRPWIGTTGADDFFRVFANNYLVFSNEQSSVVLNGCSKDPKPGTGPACAEMWERAVPSTTGDYPTGLTVGIYLKRGWNHVIVELENTVGYCTMAIDFTVHGQPVDGFVGLSPSSWMDARRMVPGSKTLANALCDRRIYQFYLE